MIIPVRTNDGRYIPPYHAHKMGWFICPYKHHYHSGTELEIETEIILCHHDALKMLEDLGFDSGKI